MIPFQSIYFWLSNGFFVDGSIESHPRHYEANFVSPLYEHGGARQLFAAQTQFASAGEAFDWLAGEILRYVHYQDFTVTKIDNPCGAPIITRHLQAQIIKKRDWNGDVLVNGQPSADGVSPDTQIPSG